MVEPLQITQDGERITVVGDVRTMADRDRLRERIMAAAASRPPEIVVDVGDAGYLDAAALIALMTAARFCAEFGTKVVLQRASVELVQQLRTTKLDRLFTLRFSEVTE